MSNAANDMVKSWEPPVCEICGSEDARKCPIMTGVGFKEPDEDQRYVCGECIICWHEGGGTTAEELRKSRGVKVEDKE